MIGSDFGVEVGFLRVAVNFSPDGARATLGFYGTFNGAIVYDVASRQRLLTRSSAADVSVHGVVAPDEP